MDESKNAPNAAEAGGADTAPRSRWRGALVGLGVLGVLAAALGYGAWSYYDRHSSVLATAQRHRDFVPNVPKQSLATIP